MRLFGIVREKEGVDFHKVVSNDPITVGELRVVLEKEIPVISKLNHFLLAVNEEYGDDSLILKEGDDIAIIPPVSGG